MTFVEAFGSDADPGIGGRELQASVALDFGAQGDDAIQSEILNQPTNRCLPVRLEGEYRWLRNRR